MRGHRGQGGEGSREGVCHCSWLWCVGEQCCQLNERLGGALEGCRGLSSALDVLNVSLEVINIQLIRSDERSELGIWEALASKQ